MPDLSVRTRGNASPQGKPRVYFSCCPEDFEVYFEPLCADIFAAQDCAVYYNAEPDTPADEAQLADMQLFVVPVTTKYLFGPCRARGSEYGFAVTHHIPVLPIAVESGISAEFAEVMNRVGEGYGDIQLLKKASDDATEIPYAEKLEKLLGSILVGNELAERVRAAFDAYIFLSYRKKDRAYAKDLMRLIHKIPYCRDIAIWYDEFLVPGEAWNKAIADAMSHSRLMTLAVTPSVIEPEDNYIVKHEYPDAVKAGKKVIAAELVPTDRETLARLFSGIAEPIDGHDEKALEAVFRDIAVRENDNSPEHTFLIGLAYLSAIDVERDPERAVGLITSAAEAGLPEAIRKLVSMYNTGEGVERDYLTAVQWQERLVGALEKLQEDPPADRDIFCALKDAGKMWEDLGRPVRARAIYERMLEHAEARDSREASVSTRRDVSIGYEKLGRVYQMEDDLAGAEEYYIKSLRLREASAGRTQTEETRRDLAAGYNALGGLYEEKGDLAGAREYYMKALRLREALAGRTQTEETRRDLAGSYNALGGLCEEKGDLAGAREYYMKSLRLREISARETRTVSARRDLLISYDDLGGLCEAEGDLPGAEGYYLKSLRLSRALVEETQTVRARRDLSVIYNELGGLCEAEGDPGRAKGYYLKSLRLSRALAEETQTVASRCDLSVIYNKLGGLCEAEGDPAGAKEYYLKDMRLSEALAEETQTVEARRDLSVSYNKLGGLCEAEGDLAGAREYYLQALRLREALAEETKTVRARRDLSVSYNDLGGLCEAEGDISGARTYYLKAVPLIRALAEEIRTPQAYDDLGVSYYTLGTLGRGARSMLEMAYDIYCRLAEKCPGVARYEKNRDFIEKYLNQ